MVGRAVLWNVVRLNILIFTILYMVLISFQWDFHWNNKKKIQDSLAIIALKDRAKNQLPFFNMVDETLRDHPALWTSATLNAEVPSTAYISVLHQIVNTVEMRNPYPTPPPPPPSKDEGEWPLIHLTHTPTPTPQAPTTFYHWMVNIIFGIPIAVKVLYFWSTCYTALSIMFSIWLCILQRHTSQKRFLP